MLSPFLLVLASAGGYWVSRRALTPVDEITQEAQSINSKNLSKRLNVLRSGDELQRLSEPKSRKGNSVPLRPANPTREWKSLAYAQKHGLYSREAKTERQCACQLKELWRDLKKKNS